jgi:outer membrane protein assembly factor BamD (BamD/ComL family)
MKQNFLILLLIPLFFLAACTSGPIVVPEDMSPSEIIQRAQEASDRNRFNDAKQYYEVLLERFGSSIDLVCTAEYEIAFLNYKQKNFTEAHAGFEQLLARYEGPDAILLPQHFRILAEKVMEKMIADGSIMTAVIAEE